MENKFNEVLLAKLRSELRKDNIKLWTEPYSNADGSQSMQLLSLAEIYSSRISQSEDEIFMHLEHLRAHSRQRLNQNSQFSASGVATLKVKLSPKAVTKRDEMFVETKLDITGQDLLNILCEKLNSDAGLLKIICNGKILNPQKTLTSQSIGHNKTILCMVFSPENRDSARSAEREMLALKKARRGAELLASSSNSLVEEYDPQIADQSGRSIDLPDEERSALTIALSLHEKGRSVLKKKRYSFALLFLLEADVEFRQCRSSILELVDNFAVLCLDISWCYLCLKNLDALPDAETRLKTSEDHLKKSYGESLQRLLSIKGNTGREVPLFVRLYLLQGVVHYYKGNYIASNELLNKALGYANTIKVDEEQVTELMALGCSASESRLALRACGGNVASASRYAFRRQEEKQEIRKREKEKSRKRKLARTLGKCANGEDVNVDLYDTMVMQLGFNERAASEALRQTNNILDRAIEAIQENPDLFKNLPDRTITNAMIAQVRN